MKTSENLRNLTDKELLTTNGGGDAWEKIGEWVGEIGSIWGNSNKKSWEICQKKGIKNRRDC
ncbi:TPA: hypothetical protein ACGXMA_002931 [Bacillus cereus]|uniref:hypothetical protein n=1 Tax=Bacillus cereus group TaxID=86661 RepID=UPI0000E8A633|nr:MULTISPECIES: hypothetical protein [Bacillus cereus group]ABK87848.1 hypothetical protein BALH_4660 [Bacillus thuringiensis str. Al Hakam]AEW58254.1 hypothetical protein bcf_25805 [Bacillus cereus F837/76]AJH67042.1 hypothetical protein BF32_2751 [Bacillus thuringiensis]KXY96763.1 hypothetical protein AT280_28655 [Bacillus cereus]MDA2015780.1 hypothetical protein [Bacillus cereus]